MSDDESDNSFHDAHQEQDPNVTKNENKKDDNGSNAAKTSKK